MQHVGRAAVGVFATFTAGADLATRSLNVALTLFAGTPSPVGARIGARFADMFSFLLDEGLTAATADTFLVNCAHSGFG